MIKDKDKFPTMIIDGEIIDLNTASEEKLEKLQEKLEQMQEEIRNKIIFHNHFHILIPYYGQAATLHIYPFYKHLKNHQNKHKNTWL